MIRTASIKDIAALENLYLKAIYRGLPEMIKWTLRKEPERVFLVEGHEKILASAYTMVCDYNNLWASYFVFEDEEEAERLVDYLLKFRDEGRYRNFYIFCPKEYVAVRVYLILQGFVPEGIRKLDGVDCIIELHDESFKPDVSGLPKRFGFLPVSVRLGESADLKTLAKLLHDTLPRDFDTLDKAAKGVEKWLREMPDYAIVAEHEGSAIGVLFISPEIYPVTDKNTAMLCYVAVDEQFRNRGVGRTLVTEGCKILRKMGKHSMQVDTSVHNIQARIFYTKVGFYPFWYSKSYFPHDNGIFYKIDF